MQYPRLTCPPPSSHCIQRATPQYRRTPGYKASVEYSSEAGWEDRAIEDVSQLSTRKKYGARNETHI